MITRVQDVMISNLRWRKEVKERNWTLHVLALAGGPSSGRVARYGRGYGAGKGFGTGWGEGQYQQEGLAHAFTYTLALSCGKLLKQF